MSEYTRATEMIEAGVGLFYRGLFMLRKSDEIREEYDAISTMIKLLEQDRAEMIKKFPNRVGSL